MLAVKILSLGILIFLFLAIYRSARRQKNHPRMRAAQKFITSFIDEVQDLSQGKGDAYEILKEAFPKHEKAYLEFRMRLRGRSRKHLDEAWRDYYCSGNGNPAPFQDQYSAGGDDRLAKEKRQKALRKIKRILSFANSPNAFQVPIIGSPKFPEAWKIGFRNAFSKQKNR
mgnify:CR=1 FL=1